MELDLMSIIIAVIGVVAGIWKAIDAAFWKKIAVDAFELVEVVKKAKSEDSPGGKELTIEEKSDIADESLDLALPLWEKLEKFFPNKKKK